MAEDDDLQVRNFQQPTQPAPEVGGAAAGAAAVLAAIAAGVTIRASDVLKTEARAGFNRYSYPPGEGQRARAIPGLSALPARIQIYHESD